MPSNNETTTKFKVDISELKKGIQEANRQIRLANSEFKAATSGMDNWSKSADGVSAKITQLNSVLTAQKSKLEILERQYELVKREQGENSKGAEELRIKINNQKAVIGDTEKQLRNYNSKLEEIKTSSKEAAKAEEQEITTLDKLKNKISEQENELDRLKEKYANIVLEQGNNSQSAQDLAREIETLSDKLNDNRTKLSEAEKSADDFDNAIKAVDENTGNTSNGFTVMKGVLSDLISSGVKLAIQGFKDLASSIKSAYDEFDEGYDNIIRATGATGDNAKDLEASYKNVAKTVKGDFDNIGSTVGEVNTRFGYTGKQLEETTVAFMKFADITGTDSVQAVKLVSRAMGDAGIKSEDYGKVLDELATAAQASGISVDRLTDNLTKYGAPMRALGFDTQESIAIFSSWEKAGVNTETAFSGMKKAISNWSKEGKDAKKEFKKTLDEIEKTPDIATATTKAIETFGTKAGPDLADAIKGGRFAYSDFLDIVKNSGGTVENTYEQTQNGFDKINLAAQSLKADVGKAFKNMIDEYAPEIEKAVEKIKEIISGLMRKITEDILPKVKEALKWISEHLPEIEAGAVGIAVAFATWKFVSLITAVSTALAGMSAAEVLAAAKTWLLNTALMANPIGLIVAAIAGLIAAFVILWNKSEAFRNFWIGLWENIKETVAPALDKVKEVFTKIWEVIQPVVEQIKALFNTALTEIKDMFLSAWEMIKAIWDFVAPYFSALWENIKSIFSVVSEVLGRFFTAAWEAIKAIWNVVAPYFSAIWESIKNIFSVEKTVLSGFFSAAWEAVKAVWNVVTGYFKMIWDNIKAIFSVVTNVFRGNFSGAWEAVKSIWNNVTGYFQSVWENIKNVFSAVISFFKNSFSSAWEAVKQVFSNVGNFFDGVWNTIKNKFSAIGTAIGDAIGYAFKTAINAVIGMVENGLNFIPNAVNGALNLINKLPGVEIPPLALFSLPRLAQGGVLKKGQVGLLEGSGAEAVVPLEKNTYWLDEIADRLNSKINGTGGYLSQSVHNSTVNNFYQTNNSPKALSRLEIYRQSKNLLAMKR